MGKQELIAEAEETFQQLWQAVSALPEEAATRPWLGEWSVKDVLAHIAGWHREMAGVLERMARGERPVPEGVDYNDTDGWNARFAQAHKGTPWPQMLAELRASKEAFLAAARQVPDDRFEEGRAAHRIMQGTGTRHYREHLEQIAEWRQREGL
ncbi:hypothetical protein HRbin25_00054 [bacterium HR25]|nr:hypothetical protein HRbin25_00054 [bacterium HR25]